MKTVVSFLLLFCVTAGAAPKAKATAKPKMAQTPPSTFACRNFAATVAKGTPTEKLKKIVDAYWKYMMNEYPEMATLDGFPGQNDRWTDQSMDAIERRKVETHCLLASLTKIPRKALSAKDQVTYDLAMTDQNLEIEGEVFATELMPVTHMSGFQVDSIDVLMSMPAETRKDFEDIAARLEKYPTIVTQNETLMREGLKRQITASKVLLPKVLAEIDGLVTPQLKDSPFYKPFVEMNSNLSQVDQETLRNRARLAINEKINPALREFKEFLSKEYIPQARATVAASDLPNGPAFYKYMIKVNTTIGASPDELHETGLKEVDRIEGEMRKIVEQVHFKGDLKAFNHFLLSDPRFYYSSVEDLLIGFRDITKRIDPELPKEFKTLPRLTYGVRAIPAFRAPSASGAEYSSGAPETGRPGWFQANTYDLKSRPKWEMETLALHEGVPGHHFQISRAQELKDLPEFRKFESNTAYVEGWALYSESLGEEMGFFKDPYSLYGHYSDELLRAVRLVVDTGIHAKGWTLEKALTYYREKLPSTDVDSANEINRYAVWPGQALAYKVGQMKIRSLRDAASKELGDKFNVREFHDVILDEGSVPMDVLESMVKNWVAMKKKTSGDTTATVVR